MGFVCVFFVGYSSTPDWSMSCDHGLDYASLSENNNNIGAFYIMLVGYKERFNVKTTHL